ncbi:unnamed protein product [Paramecium sonneborni]|uniref:Uncharacterized protein n=1 Tax=Paramecium sonneborni TaxID=65129 RepID=A0A8S1M0Z8_9CILI|nr:unnamed protein product [Paramecium sonneborni]
MKTESGQNTKFQKGYTPMTPRKSLNLTQIKFQQQQNKQGLPPVIPKNNYNDEQAFDIQNQQRNFFEEQSKIQNSYSKRSLVKSPIHQEAHRKNLEQYIKKASMPLNQIEGIIQQNVQTGLINNNFQKVNYKNDRDQKLDKTKEKNQEKNLSENAITQDQLEINNQIIQNEQQNNKGIGLKMAIKTSELQNLNENIQNLLKERQYIINFMKLDDKIRETQFKPQKLENYRSHSFEIGKQSFEKIEKNTLKINEKISNKINDIIQQKEEIKNLNHQIQILQQEKQTQRTQIEEKEKTIEILDQEKQNYAEINKNLSNDIEQKNSQNINLEITIQNQNIELQNLQSQIEIKNQSINEDIERLNQELEKCKQEIEIKKEETVQKSQNNEITNSEIEKLNLKLTLQEQQNDILTKELESLKQEIITLKKNEEHQKNEDQNKDQISANLKLEIEKNQNKFQEDTQLKDQMIENLNIKIQELQKQLQDKEEQIEDLQNEIELQQYREKSITLLVTAKNLNRNEEIKVKLMDSVNDLYVMANFRGIFNELPIRSDLKAYGKTFQKKIEKHEWQKKLYELFVPSQYNQQIQMEFSILQ